MVAQEAVQRLSRSTIPAPHLILPVNHVKDPHHHNPPPVAHQLRMDNLAWVQHPALVRVPLRDSHPREALPLRVPHQTLLYPVATPLHHHKGMVRGREHVHPHKDNVLVCQVLWALCLRRACSRVVCPLCSSLSRCLLLVSPHLKAPHQGESECHVLIILLSIGYYTACSLFHNSISLILLCVKVESIQSPD